MNPRGGGVAERGLVLVPQPGDDAGFLVRRQLAGGDVLEHHIRRTLQIAAPGILGPNQIDVRRGNLIEPRELVGHLDQRTIPVDQVVEQGVLPGDPQVDRWIRTCFVSASS